MPMTKEEKNARARARRAAAKAQPTETVQDVNTEITDAEPTTVESVMVATGVQSHEGGFIEADPAEILRQREQLVLDLAAAFQESDAKESAAILGMIEAVRQGADPKEFANAFHAIISQRMIPTSAKSRKSNLMGVLTTSAESQEFVIAISPKRDEKTGEIRPETVLGLQAMYKLRQAMLKGPDDGEAKPKRAKADKAEDDTDDIESSMSPTDLLLHQITLAIDASVNAGFLSIAENLRVVFHKARAAIVEAESEQSEQEPALV